MGLGLRGLGFQGLGFRVQGFRVLEFRVGGYYTIYQGSIRGSFRDFGGVGLYGFRVMALWV